MRKQEKYSWENDIETVRKTSESLHYIRYWLILYEENTKHSKYESYNETNPHTYSSHRKYEANTCKT